MIKKFENIRTGVIGVGSMGQNHARIYSEISNLVGVSDSNEDQGRNIASRFGVKWYKNYEDMLSDVDCVSISVPTYLHREISENVAKHGVNILVEKPLAGNVVDAEAIITSAKLNKIVLSVGQIERHNGVVRKAKELLDSGIYGEILTITARRFSNYPERIHDVGVLFDLTIHDVDVISYLIGKSAKYVFATGGKAKNLNHEDYVNLSITYSNGKIGLCETNWLTPMKIREINITTDVCHMNVNYLTQSIKLLSSEYNNLDKSNLYDNPIKIREENFTLKKEEPLRNEIIDFLSSVVSKKEPLVSGLDGLNAVKIVESGLISLNSNSVVKL